MCIHVYVCYPGNSNRDCHASCTRLEAPVPVYICAYMCTYVYICVYMCMSIYVHICVCVYMCTHVYTCVFMLLGQYP